MVVEGVALGHCVQGITKVLFYLPAAKMVPLADPKVEMATESGMIHENIPKILLPKV